MGWGGGYDIYARMTKTISNTDASYDDKKVLVKELIMALEQHDWDGLGDVDITEEDAWAQDAIHIVHPDWWAEWAPTYETRT